MENSHANSYADKLSTCNACMFYFFVFGIWSIVDRDIIAVVLSMVIIVLLGLLQKACDMIYQLHEALEDCSIVLRKAEPTEPFKE